MTQAPFSFGGFRDGHCHPLFAEREGVGPDLTACKSVKAITDALSAYLLANPGVNWIDCGSFEPGLGGPDGLHRRQLDEVSRSVPIVVHASDHHAIWVNSAALEVAGLAERALIVPHAVIEVDGEGVPTGILREWDAMALIYKHQPRYDLESDLQALERAQLRLLAAGVVAVQEAWIDPGMPEVYIAAAKRDVLRLRVNMAARINPASWRDDLQFAKVTRSAVRATQNVLLTCNTVKVFIDGVIGSETALMSDAYCGGGHGSDLWEQADLLEMALAADSAGFQLHFHAIGDAAVSKALSAIEHVDLQNGPVDRRSVIAHAELIGDQDMIRLRQLRAIVCQQPVWAVPGAGVSDAEDKLGSSRAANLYPIASLLEAGVVVSFGSDWPVSAPEPLYGVYAATERRMPGQHTQHTPEQAVTREQALRAYSVAVGLQLGQDQSIHEDLVELDTNLATCTPEQLLAAKVLRVVVAGKEVWKLT